MLHKTSVIIALLLLILRLEVCAQEWQTEKRFNVLFGLSQPLVAHGFNFELNYVFNRFIVDFSHGIDLTFSGQALPASLEKQGVEVHMPWTTGFGI